MVGVAIVTARKFLKAKKKNGLIIKNQNLVDRSLKFAESEIY